VVAHRDEQHLVKNGELLPAIRDGTHVRLRENHLLGSQHIRYGAYGGIAYHHIADSYIALFTSFIPCGVWEAVHRLCRKHLPTGPRDLGLAATVSAASM
jgi:hypothetical protein